MKRHYLLTWIWLGFFALGLVVVEAYFWRRVEVAGQLVRILTNESRMPVYTAFAQIYSPTLLYIGATWYFKAPEKLRSSEVEKFRFRLAVFSTMVFNVIVLLMVSAFHFSIHGDLDESLDTTKKVALLLAVLVAWPNYYYFKAPKPGGSTGSIE